MDSVSRARGEKKLQLVSEIVGCGGRVCALVDTLLSWFDRVRRGDQVVGTIQRVLEDCGLQTDPDFADRGRYDKYTRVEFRRGPLDRTSPPE